MTTPPISYIDRTRAYYQALGYGAPYRWAENSDIPWAPLGKTLPKAQVAVVTTAAPFQPGKGDQGPGAPHNAAAKFYQVYEAPVDPLPDLRISHIAIDRDHTTAEDIGSYLPVAALQRARDAGRIRALCPTLFGLPTNRSHRTTLEKDCPTLVARVLAAGADAAILAPNCPVCHQSVTLAARALETVGIASVVLACARDIVVRAGAPRVLFSDFPLGNAAGKPGDRASQDATVSMALDVLEQATAPGTVWTSPQIWSEDPSWKEDYSNAAKLSAEEIARRRAAFDAGKAVAQKLRAES